MRKIVATYQKTTDPTSAENIAAGYNVGQWWRNTNTGALFYHKSDGVWENVTDAISKAQNSLQKGQGLISSTTYEGVWYNATADADTDVITCPDITFEDNMAVEIRANTGTRPAPLAEYTTTYWGTYYNVVNASGNTCKLTSNIGGSALDIASAGTEGWQIRVCPPYVDVSIPPLNVNGCVDCRIFLQLAKRTATATGFWAMVNNDTSAINYNGAIDTPNLLPAIELLVSIATGMTLKYQMGVLGFTLKRASASSLWVSADIQFKARSNNSGMAANYNIAQVAGSQRNHIVGLANEVSFVRFSPINTANSVIRSIKVDIYQN